MADPFPVTDRLKRGRFVITAEQASPAQMKRYNSLTRRGVIDAVTLPDLPLIARIRDARALVSGGLPSADPLHSIEETEQPIATVSAALRTREKVKAHILTAVERGSRAILALSGGGLSRRVAGPLGRVALPMNAFRTLELADELRRSGDIPGDMPLWAVENPIIQTVQKRVDRLARKIDAGAETILTQPPLLWDRFESWWNEVDRRGLNQTPILVGMPIPRTIEMLRTWFFLAGLGAGGREGREVMKPFREASALDQDDFDAFWIGWTVDLLKRVKALPGVAGIHVMPIVGSRGLEDLFTQASINQHQRARSDLQAVTDELRREGVAVVHEPGLSDDRYIRRFVKNLDALSDARSSVTPGSSFSTYWNRIAYRQHFRRPLARRPFVSDEPEEKWELAIDLRQWSSPEDLGQGLEQALPRFSEGQTESEGGVPIGDFVPYSKSIVWDFNAAFWNHVIPFVAAHERDYRDAIKGSPDSNPDFIRHNAEGFYRQVRNFRSSDTERFCYVEIGVASIDYARTFIDTVVTLAQADAFDLGPVTYVLSDTSHSVLKRAEMELGPDRRGISLEYVHANAESPHEVLKPFSGRILRVHVTNVFDNLPGDKLAQISDAHFLIETRLYLPAEAHIALCEHYELNPETFRKDLEAIPLSGVDAFLGNYRSRFHQNHGETQGDLVFYHFWQELIGNPDNKDTGLKLEERYRQVDLSELDFVRPGTIPAGVSGRDILQEILLEYPRNVWLHLSNRGVEGGLQLLDLLHDHGALEIVDIIVRKIEDYHNVPQRFTSKGTPIYRMGFKGPAKYDGSAVDWFNGRVLEAAAKAVYPSSEVRYEDLEAFGKPQMTLMEVKKSRG